MTFKDIFKELTKEEDLIKLGEFSRIYYDSIKCYLSNEYAYRFFPTIKDISTRSRMSVYISTTNYKPNSIILMANEEGEVIDSSSIIDNNENDFIELKIVNVPLHLPKPQFNIDKNYVKIYCNSYCGVKLYGTELNVYYIASNNRLNSIIFTTKGFDYVK